MPSTRRFRASSSSALGLQCGSPTARRPFNGVARLSNGGCSSTDQSGLAATTSEAACEFHGGGGDVKQRVCASPAFTCPTATRWNSDKYPSGSNGCRGF